MAGLGSPSSPMSSLQADVFVGSPGRSPGHSPAHSLVGSERSTVIDLVSPRSASRASQCMPSFVEEQIIPLRGFSNVYSLCTTGSPHFSRALVASCSAVQYIGILPTDVGNNWHVEALLNMPAERDITAVDSIEGAGGEYNAGRVTYVAVTTVHRIDRTAQLHIYKMALEAPHFVFSKNDVGEEADDLAHTARKHQPPMDLSFAPFLLTHVAFPDNPEFPAFVVTGPDCGAHYYFLQLNEDDPSAPALFVEEEEASPLPELADLSAIMALDVRWVDVYRKRVVAAGCQDGRVMLAITSAEGSPRVHNVYLDGPVPSLGLWWKLPDGLTPHSFASPVRTTKLPFLPFMPGAAPEEENSCSLAVADGVGSAVVFRDVARLGLSSPQTLPGSDDYDTVLCVLCADVDYDGRCEILVGTYGQELLMYRAHEELEGCTSPSPLRPPHPQEEGFDLIWKCSLPSPVYAIDAVDINEDGVLEIVVVTMFAVHVLQPDVDVIAQRIRSRQKEVTDRLDLLHSLMEQSVLNRQLKIALEDNG